MEWRSPPSFTTHASSGPTPCRSPMTAISMSPPTSSITNHPCTTAKTSARSPMLSSASRSTPNLFDCNNHPCAPEAPHTMNISLKPLSQQTIVITGATSGIGLATAKAAAKRGANLVLAARNEQALADITRELEASGTKAIYVVTDVSRHDEVDRLAQAAINTFGGFDTWVNNAGQGLWGRLDQVSDEDHRRLFDINFWGVVYGSTTALRHLKQ